MENMQTVFIFIAGFLFIALASKQIGGLATMQQKQLSQLLAQHHLAPTDYIHFLDYAAERSLLRKVGGGYMFVHLLLLDYFKEIAKE